MVWNDEARQGLRSEAGIAMVMVIAITSVLAILMVAAVSMALGGLNKSRTDQDWNAALAAAYAGVEEYQSQLADDPAYMKYGNPASTFSGSSTLELPIAAEENKAFGVGPTGTWATITGSDSKYRYEVDNTAYNTTGIIKLRATGAIGNETRSLVANLRQTGFIDFLYFTDYEIGDPTITGETSCVVKYAWQGSRPNCSRIRFADDDFIGGPLHTNDTIYTCGAEFAAKVTTGNPSGGYDSATSCSDAPDFRPGSPAADAVIPMPSTNKIMARYTRSDLKTEDVPVPGCLYTGPTEITLNTDGTMTVKSPWTKATNVKGDDLEVGYDDPDTDCGTPLQLQTGVTVPVPDNNVVYVQNIPDAGVNYSSQSATTGSSSRCKNVDGTIISKNSVDSTKNIVGYPKHATEKSPVNGTGQDASYGCRNGDLFIKGALNGTTATFGAEHYVYVTGDVTYTQPDDMLGLIGGNAVWVWNPMNCNTGCYFSDGRQSPFTWDALLGSDVDRHIDAAILSVAHTFMVQNYSLDNNGTRGTLTVNGAIAQKFRGAVGANWGSFRTGYTKEYIYDSRLQFNAPPRFLSPVTSTYGVNIWVEVSPVYDADGNYR